MFLTSEELRTKMKLEEVQSLPNDKRSLCTNKIIFNLNISDNKVYKFYAQSFILHSTNFFFLKCSIRLHPVSSLLFP